ncbi:hypothetical protein F4604DRAFT_1233114 [Suillus subluteus]|nr:hypothetical protein F4604DRAFT_1233114 [Suillus subluteus]
MSESLTSQEFVDVLDKLNILLTNLPSQLPLANDYYDSQYCSFLSFPLDPDILEKTGDEVATLGEQLESVFGWKARTSGDSIIPILERGKAICALHGILKLYYEKYPTNDVLKKWVNDITAGAEKVYEKYGTLQTGHADNESESTPGIDGMPDSDDEDGGDDGLLESGIDERQPAQAAAFEIHPEIDIDSKALKDMVSTHPLSAVSIDSSSVLSSQAPTTVTDDSEDADWNY